MIFAWGQVLRRDLPGSSAAATAAWLEGPALILLLCPGLFPRFAARTGAGSIRNKRSSEEPARRGQLSTARVCSFLTVARLGSAGLMLYQRSLDPRLG